jgi:hypothetical protein
MPFSIVHVPVVKYNIYVVEHTTEQEPLDIMDNYRPAETKGVTYLGDVYDENESPYDTTVEGEFSTFEEAFENWKEEKNNG